ncbi:hypothetical protein ABK040_011288 [Willaertia magna]
MLKQQQHFCFALSIKRASAKRRHHELFLPVIPFPTSTSITSTKKNNYSIQLTFQQQQSTTITTTIENNLINNFDEYNYDIEYSCLKEEYENINNNLNHNNHFNNNNSLSSLLLKEEEEDEGQFLQQHTLQHTLQNTLQNTLQQNNLKEEEIIEEEEEKFIKKYIQNNNLLNSYLNETLLYPKDNLNNLNNKIYNLMNNYLENKNYIEIENLFLKIEKKESFMFTKVLIAYKELKYLNKFDNLIKYLNKNNKLNASQLNISLNFYLERKEYKILENLYFNNLNKINDYHKCIMIKYFCKINNITKAFNIYESLQQVPNNNYILNELLNCLINNFNQNDKINNLIILQKIDYIFNQVDYPDIFTIITLLKGYIKFNKINLFLEKLKNNYLKFNTNHFNILFHYLYFTKNYNLILNLFKMNKLPNISSYNILLKTLIKLEKYKIAEDLFFKKLNLMNENSFTIILKMFKKLNNFNKMIEIFNLNSLQKNIYHYNLMIECYFNLNNLNKCKEIFNFVYKNNLINISTYNIMITILTNNFNNLNNNLNIEMDEFYIHYLYPLFKQYNDGNTLQSTLQQNEEEEENIILLFNKYLTYLKFTKNTSKLKQVINEFSNLINNPSKNSNHHYNNHYNNHHYNNNQQPHDNIKTQTIILSTLSSEECLNYLQNEIKQPNHFHIHSLMTSLSKEGNLEKVLEIFKKLKLKQKESFHILFKAYSIYFKINNKLIKNNYEYYLNLLNDMEDLFYNDYLNLFNNTLQNNTLQSTNDNTLQNTTLQNNNLQNSLQNIYLINSILSCYSQFGKFNEILNFLKFIKVDKNILNLKSYNYILTCLRNEGKFNNNEENEENEFNFGNEHFVKCLNYYENYLPKRDSISFVIIFNCYLKSLIKIHHLNNKNNLNNNLNNEINKEVYQYIDISLILKLFNLINIHSDIKAYYLLFEVLNYFNKYNLIIDIYNHIENLTFKKELENNYFIKIAFNNVVVNHNKRVLNKESMLNGGIVEQEEDNYTSFNNHTITNKFKTYKSINNNNNDSTTADNTADNNDSTAGDNNDDNNGNVTKNSNNGNISGEVKTTKHSLLKRISTICNVDNSIDANNNNTGTTTSTSDNDTATIYNNRTVVEDDDDNNNTTSISTTITTEKKKGSRLRQLLSKREQQ